MLSPESEQCLNSTKRWDNFFRRSPLLINVTHFFRDTAAWESLENEILPILIEQTKPHEELRFWVTACSTGEEAYSLAILLREALESVDKPLTVKIFATDIDRTALEKAAAGIYPQSIANDITSERLQKYFIFKDNHYQVIRQLREMLIFSPHDLTKDISFTRINLISCRNVLIYMQSEPTNVVLCVTKSAVLAIANIDFFLKIRSLKPKNSVIFFITYRGLMNVGLNLNLSL
ncbi:MAG: CheR family methyltransferase [Xenococcaceae cyanobacterium MO_188.B32]|nr:CheR family methyltransferase [Xenococcaceae cyanobacterium MO_188.B32]